MRSAAWWVICAVMLSTVGSGCRQAAARGAGASEGTAPIGLTAAVTNDEADAGTAGEHGGARAPAATTDVASPPGREPPDAESEELVFNVKIPKPEAMIFEKRADTSIQPIDDKKSFLDRIGDPVGKEPPPSEGKE